MLDFGNLKVEFNKKDSRNDKNKLYVFVEKNNLKRFIVRRKIDKEEIEKNKAIIIAPYKGYKELIVIPFEKKKINPYLLSKIVPKITENSTVDLRQLKDLQELAVEFILNKSYSFNKYKSEKKEIRINFLTSKKSLDELINKMDSLSKIRELINEPSNVLTPEEFVKRAKELLKGLPVEIEVFNKEKLKKENFNLLLAVAKGSKNDPYLLVVKYLPKKDEKAIALVGKGVCFDTGGYYVKPSPYMNEMYMDMSGAAVVLGVIMALAKNKIEKNVIAVIPLVENSIDGNAYKPSDIIKSRSGKSVEIEHTDAEGRLILADAIDYALEFDPKEVITVATLTGAAIIALGEEVAAVMSNDEKSTEKLKKIGLEIEERVWPLPLWDLYKELIESERADIKNLNKGREAGTIIGGIFLKEFAKDKKFIHLDIAGPAMPSKERRYLTNGSGFGLRLLYEYIKRHK